MRQKLKKTKYLCHTSSNPNIAVLLPLAESVRDPNEGPAVLPL